jgi:hypothetical protein
MLPMAQYPDPSGWSESSPPFCSFSAKALTIWAASPPDVATSRVFTPPAPSGPANLSPVANRDGFLVVAPHHRVKLLAVGLQVASGDAPSRRYFL